MSKSAWWGEDIIPRIAWRVLINEGDEIPDGYGIAYYVADTRRALCMPLPFNVIVGLARSWYWHLRCPPWRFTEYKLGLGRRFRADAWGEGFIAGCAAERYGIESDGRDGRGPAGRDLRNPYR